MNYLQDDNINYPVIGDFILDIHFFSDQQKIYNKIFLYKINSNIRLFFCINRP